MSFELAITCSFYITKSAECGAICALWDYAGNRLFLNSTAAHYNAKGISVFGIQLSFSFLRYQASRAAFIASSALCVCTEKKKKIKERLRICKGEQDFSIKFFRFSASKNVHTLFTFSKTGLFFFFWIRNLCRIRTLWDELP